MKDLISIAKKAKAQLHIGQYDEVIAIVAVANRYGWYDIVIEGRGWENLKRVVIAENHTDIGRQPRETVIHSLEHRSF